MHETRAILEEDAEGLDALTWNRFEVIDRVLNKKCGLLAGFNEEIQQRCNIKELEEETDSRCYKRENASRQHVIIIITHLLMTQSACINWARCMPFDT